MSRLNQAKKQRSPWHTLVRSGRRLLSVIPVRLIIWRLNRGYRVRLRGRGNSMRGLIESGQAVWLRKVPADALVVGDLVFCRVDGRPMLHMIARIEGGRYLITNARGKINGWTDASQIHGKVDEIEPVHVTRVRS